MGEETEVATADFTWVLYVPGGEVLLASTPHLTGVRGMQAGRGRGEGGRALSNSCLH